MVVEVQSMQSCSGPCTQTGPLHAVEPDAVRHDILMYAGHSHTLYVRNGLLCAHCRGRLQQLYEEWDDVIENEVKTKDSHMLHEIENRFEDHAENVFSKLLEFQNDLRLRLVW